MAATAEISQPSTAVRFAAKRDGLRLTKDQRYPVYGPNGAKVGELPGKALKFKDHALVVTEEGVRMAEGGDMPREEALKFLREHPLFGDQQEGFWEIFQAAPPVGQAETEALMAAALDEGALVALIESEEAGWNREAVLSPARSQLARVREKLAEIAAERGEEIPKRAPRGK